MTRRAFRQPSAVFFILLLGTTFSASLRSVATSEAADDRQDGLALESSVALESIIAFEPRVTQDPDPGIDGRFSYTSDGFGRSGFQQNFDRLHLTLAGQTRLPRLSFSLLADGLFDDRHPETRRSHSHRDFLGLFPLGDRKHNEIRLEGTVKFRLGRGGHLLLRMRREDERFDLYRHAWSRVGFVETFTDTTQTGDIVLRHGRFSTEQLDPTFQPYNPADHTPTHENEFTEVELSWDQPVSTRFHFQSKLGRTHRSEDERVRGKEPFEYEGNRLGDLWFNYTDRDSEEFFVLAGDYPWLETLDARSYVWENKITGVIGEQKMEAGFDLGYLDSRSEQVLHPFLTDIDGGVGLRSGSLDHDPYFAGYIRNRWSADALLLTAGLRFDRFDLGNRLPLDGSEDLVVNTLSPQLVITYRMPRRSTISFEYSRFHQVQDPRVYQRGPSSALLFLPVDPELEPETVISYRIGLGAGLGSQVRGRVSAYYQDISGVIDVAGRPSTGSIGFADTFVNGSYATDRGIEFDLERRGFDGFGWSLHYGLAESKEAQTATFRAGLEILRDFDVRHTLRLEGRFVDSRLWAATIRWSYLGGLPYTPTPDDPREIAPESVNSARQPTTTHLDADLERYLTISGRSVKVFLELRNLLDTVNVAELAPSNWPYGPGRIPVEYLQYLTETGRYGGGMIRRIGGEAFYIPLRDPRVFGSSRNVRLGFAYTF